MLCLGCFNKSWIWFERQFNCLFWCWLESGGECLPILQYQDLTLSPRTSHWIIMKQDSRLSWHHCCIMFPRIGVFDDTMSQCWMNCVPLTHCMCWDCHHQPPTSVTLLLSLWSSNLKLMLILKLKKNILSETNYNLIIYLKHAFL